VLRLRFSSLSIALAVATAVLATGCGPSKAELLEVELDESISRETALKRSLDSLKQAYKFRPEVGEISGGHPLVNGSRLSRMGIPNAELRLDSYLNDKHPELIPFDGMLGGTMQFERAVPLADRFVFASVSDGHVQGFVLLQYDANNKGGVDWKTVYEWRDW
jgi:hypothetical protein